MNMTHNETEAKANASRVLLASQGVGAAFHW
jgi:hypothetical protein